MTKPFCGVLRLLGLQTFNAQGHTKLSLITKQHIMNFSKKNYEHLKTNKNKMRKTPIKVFKKLILLCLIIMTSACSKEDSMNPSPTTGEIEELSATISLDEFETDEGEIGIVISAREIAKKGYKPTTATISIDATSNIDDQEVSFDEFNNLANLSFKNEDLEDTFEDELKEGVPVDVTIKDENGSVLVSKSFSKLSFKASPDAQEVSANNLDDLFAKVSLKNNILHFAQIADENNVIIGAPVSQLYESTSDLTAPIVTKRISDSNLDYNGDYPTNYTTFYFEELPGEEDVFNISVRNGSNIHYLYTVVSGAIGQLNIQSKANLTRNGGNTDATVRDNYKFKIEKFKPGLYTITSVKQNKKLVLAGDLDQTNDLRLVAKDETTNHKTAYFRILSFAIDWDIQAVESKFVRPIMPPSTTSSAYNSTLRNCSSGSLNQTIGESTTITTTQTAAWEETMSVATTNSAGVSVTISHEAETKFFGVGGKTSASITGNYQYTKTETETNTKSGSISTQKSVQVSVSREVGVPPGTAISVADVYQQYQNIKVPFIQRFRIFGKYQENNTELTGQQILTQFTFNSFTGVVTDVQSNFIEVTVRGVTIIDRLIETTTETRDIPNACN